MGQSLYPQEEEMQKKCIPLRQKGPGGTWDSGNQIANIRWIIEKARELQKNIYLCFIDYAKAFDSGSQQTIENS